MILARVKALTHWGYWVRYPLASALQDTYVIPQPSTLLGAFLYGLSKALHIIANKELPEVIIEKSTFKVPLA